MKVEAKVSIFLTPICSPLLVSQVPAEACVPPIDQHLVPAVKPCLVMLFKKQVSMGQDHHLCGLAPTARMVTAEVQKNGAQK